MRAHLNAQPILRAFQVYKLEPCRRLPNEDLELHLAQHHVHSTPEYFIMGKPVPHAADPALIVDATFKFPLEQCDCWHVYLAAGDMRLFLQHDRYGFDWVSWERQNELRVYPMDKIRRKLNAI